MSNKHDPAAASPSAAADPVAADPAAARPVFLEVRERSRFARPMRKVDARKYENMWNRKRAITKAPKDRPAPVSSSDSSHPATDIPTPASIKRRKLMKIRDTIDNLTVDDRVPEDVVDVLLGVLVGLHDLLE